MPCLVDTDVLIDVSRNNQGAITWIDHLGDDWALSAMTALELISGAKNKREVQLIDRLSKPTRQFLSPMLLASARTICSRSTPSPTGLRTFDSLIAATAIEEQKTLVTRNHKHFKMISGLAVDVPSY
jgi:predicted nucleic acid-binding protein